MIFLDRVSRRDITKTAVFIRADNANKNIDLHSDNTSVIVFMTGKLYKQFGL